MINAARKTPLTRTGQVGHTFASHFSRALCQGFEEANIKLKRGIGVAEGLIDARSLFLTANKTTVCATFCIDLKDGPMVVRVPHCVLGPVDDADYRWVVDVGLTGPDRGKGGDYLFVPPDYKRARENCRKKIERRTADVWYARTLVQQDLPAR
jgi:hypothetical protein